MTRHRPGDQPLPVRRDDHPGAHHVVIRDSTWADLVPDMDQEMFASIMDGVLRDLGHRRQIGLERYGSPLQPNNGRNTLLDLYEELLDGLVYAWTAQEEAMDRGDEPGAVLLAGTYDVLRVNIIVIRGLLDEADEPAQARATDEQEAAHG